MDELKAEQLRLSRMKSDAKSFFKSNEARKQVTKDLKNCEITSSDSDQEAKAKNPLQLVVKSVDGTTGKAMIQVQSSN